jgi:centromere protein V
MITHKGGCHCGRVRFEVDAPATLVVDDCNCSMCYRTGYLHLIVTKDRFRIVQGEEALVTYTFNTRTARHLFCGTCGIKPFYVPRSHPDGWSVNVRCIDAGTVKGMKVNAVDGKNWEQHYPAGRGEFVT